MLSLITSYLLQSGKCSLPHIGSFNSEYISAQNDIINKQILPPAEEIIFSEETILPVADELVKYIALNKAISENNALNQLDKFCNEWKQKIDAGEQLCLETLGCLKKNGSGVIIFSPENDKSYYSPVSANKILKQNAKHAVLVGDTQTTSTAMNEYYNNYSVVTKNNWRIWALTLFLISLIMIFYSFYNHKFSSSAVGNRSHFIIKDAGETHFELSK